MSLGGRLGCMLAAMSDDKPNVHPLPDRRDEGKARNDRLERLMSDTETLEREARAAAKYRKLQYDALRQAGFNDYQALVIVAKML